MSDSLQIKNVISEESNNSNNSGILPLPPVFIPEGSKQTSLSTSWAFWCQKKNKKTKTTTTNWSEGTQCVGRFSTAEGFWHLYTHIVRADKIQGSVDVMLFRDGIRPVWEDEANKLGGKLSIKLKKGLSALLWEELILGMIGEQLADCDICGAVLSVRFHDDTIALWLRNADSEESVNAAKNAFKDILRLPPWCQAEFSRFSRRVGGGGGGGVEGVDGVDEHSALPTSSSSHHQQRFSGNGGPTGASWKQHQQQQLQNLAPSTSSSSSERLTHQTSGQHQSSHFQQQNQHQRGGSGGLNTEKILILGGPGGQSTLTVGGISSASAAGLSLASARAGNATKPQEGYPVSTSQQQQQQSSSSFTTSDSGLSSLPLSNMASLSLRPKTLAATSLQNSSSLPLTSTSGGGSNSTVTSSGAEDRSSSTNANSQPVSPQPAWGGAKLHSSNASLSPINSSSVTSVSTTVKPYQGSMVQIQGVGGIQQSIISQSVSPVVQTHSQPTHIQSQQQQSQSHHPQQQQQQQQQHIQQQQMQLNSGSVQREFPSQQFQHHQPQGGQFQRQPHYSHQQHQAHRSGYQGQNQQQHSQSSSSQKHNSDQALASAPAPTVDTDGDGWETVAKKR